MRCSVAPETWLMAACAVALLTIQIATVVRPLPPRPGRAVTMIEVGIITNYGDFSICHVCQQLGQPAGR